MVGENSIITITIPVSLDAYRGVFTPLACDKRHERIQAISEEISKGDFDIVMLQEIWTQGDFSIIVKKVENVYPHNHYFSSGMFGTGCCIFSKYPIRETFLHKFHLNGYMHRVQHGDWFGGKGVGLAKIDMNGILINAFVTHFHAEYLSPPNDEYHAHRMSQAFEASQFIKNMSETCDLIVFGGDFNTRPDDTGYKIIKSNGILKDAWIDQRQKPDGTGMTSDIPSNSFRTKNAQRLQEFPEGERLDYLFYRGNGGYNFDCMKSYLTWQKVPGQDYNFSDHEGVAAEFDLRRNITAMGPEMEIEDRDKHLTDAMQYIHKGLLKTDSDRLFYIGLIISSFMVLLILGSFEAPWLLGVLWGFSKFVASITLTYSLWTVIVLLNCEQNGLMATRKDIMNLISK